MFPATSLPHKRMNWSGRTELNCLHEFPGLGCSHYTTPRNLVRQVRLELTIPCLRGRCLDPIWLLTHGGTERTRTVIGLVDNQVPHLSATVPYRLGNADFRMRIGVLSMLDWQNQSGIRIPKSNWVGRRESNPQPL